MLRYEVCIYIAGQKFVYGLLHNQHDAHFLAASKDDVVSINDREYDRLVAKYDHGVQIFPVEGVPDVS